MLVHDLFHAGENLIEREVGGVDDYRVRRGGERRLRPSAVPAVAGAQLRQNRLRRLCAGFAVLLVASVFTHAL